MSSITASEVFRNRLLADGRRRIHYKYTIQANDLVEEIHFVGPFHRPGAWDVSGNLSGYGDALLDSLKEAEIDVTFQLAKTQEEKVENLTQLQALQSEIFANVDSPRYTIKKRLQKKLIYYLMRRGDVHFAMNIKTVWDGLPATDTAKKARLDLNQTQLDRLLAKVEEFYGTPASAKSGMDIVNSTGAFMSEREDWGEV